MGLRSRRHGQRFAVAAAGTAYRDNCHNFGTGSEINCWGVISNHATNEKIGFGCPELNPVLAVVDPELMRTVPAKYNCLSRFHALFHNTEVMISRFVNVLSKTVALSAIEYIAKYLPRAVKDGKRPGSPRGVAYGSTIAGLTMQLTSTTAEHSMEHAMSAYHHNLPHGAGLIMISNESTASSSSVTPAMNSS